MSRQKKLALSMRGGGARCAGYLGVIEALVEAGIKIDIVVGSSMGATIGYLYGIGYTIDQLVEIATTLNRSALLSFKSISQQNLLSVEKSKKILLDYTKGKKIEDTTYKMYIQATDVEDWESTIFEKGDAIDALMASMSYPLLFPSIKIEGRRYVDGDIASGYASDFLRKKGAEYVIGMSTGINSEDVYKDILPHKLIIPISIAYHVVQKQDLLINPVDVLFDGLGKDAGFLDLRLAQELREYGHNAAKKNTDRIKKQLYTRNIFGSLIKIFAT